ncbi:coil containing protein [Vibrio phage 1.246.O._10N.261.54.E10]|nr:coil containing protein [Vibrio phage 1.246.O._10N.261.54.E10]
MRLYDFNPDNNTNIYFGTIESFDGGSEQLRHKDVTKSFRKAKKEALKRLCEHKVDLENAIKEVEAMTEKCAYHRDSF